MYLKNTPGQYISFALIDPTTMTGFLGAAVTGKRKIDDQAQASVTGTITEAGGGQYTLAMSADDINGNAIGFLFTAPGAIPVELNIVTEPGGLAVPVPGTGAVDIVNKALRRIGVAPITVLGADGTPQDNLMAAIYVDVVKEVQRQHPWNVLRARRQLQYSTTTLTLSSLAVGTGITATAGAATFIEDDVGGGVNEITVTGATGVSTITDYTSPTVVTVDTTTAWSTLTPGANNWQLTPINGDFNYVYFLPSDFLCARSIDIHSGSWQIEGQRFLSDSASAILHYTKYQSDATYWEVLLQEAIVAKLALEACWPLTKDSKLMADLGALFVAKLKEAEGTNKSERQPLKPRISATTLADVR